MILNGTFMRIFTIKLIGEQDELVCVSSTTNTILVKVSLGKSGQFSGEP